MAADLATLRVLMTADTVGGVWTHALELARGLALRGIGVDLATMGAPLSARQRDDAARVPGLALHESSFRLEWMAEPWDDVERAGQWLLELEVRLRPHIVHLNQFAFGALPFGAPKLLVAHSCVLSWWRAVHGGEAPDSWDRYRGVVRAGLEGADLVGAPTRAMLASLQQEHGHSRSGVVLPNGRSGREFVPAHKEPLVLSAGRLWDEAKNLSALEAVAPSLAWPVCVAGPTGEPGAATREARGVRVLGELSSAALAEQMSHAAIYALPARYEPFGQSALEAALSGCALVLGDIASLREVWGTAALYVAPGDHDALRSTLARLIDDSQRRRRLGADARTRALQFTPERMVDAYLLAYSRITRRSTPVPAQRVAPVGRTLETTCAS